MRTIKKTKSNTCTSRNHLHVARPTWLPSTRVALTHAHYRRLRAPIPVVKNRRPKELPAGKIDPNQFGVRRLCIGGCGKWVKAGKECGKCAKQRRRAGAKLIRKLDRERAARKCKSLAEA